MLFTSPEGREHAARFFDRLMVMQLNASHREPVSYLFEFLVLTGSSRTNQDAAELESEEARKMGLSEEDLEFLQLSTWKTHAKLFLLIAHGSDFSANIGDVDIHGNLEGTLERPFMRLVAECDGRHQLFASQLALNLDETTILASSNAPGEESETFVVIVRVSVD